MAERRVILHQQFEVGGTGDDAEQQLRQPHQRRRVLARAYLRQQARHQLIEHVAAARADGAFVDVVAEIGDGAQHLSAPSSSRCGVSGASSFSSSASCHRLW